MILSGRWLGTILFPMPRALLLPVAKEKSSEIGAKDGDYAAWIGGRITLSGMEQNPKGGRHKVGRQ